MFKTHAFPKSAKVKKWPQIDHLPEFAFIDKPTMDRYNQEFLICSLLSVGLGIGSSWSSPIVFKLQNVTNRDNQFGHAISSNEVEWIGSLNNIGCAIGPIPFGLLADKIGRKPCLLIAGLFYLTSFTTLAFTEETSLYYAGRLLMGFGFAGTITVNPAYLSEIAHHEDRAKLNFICTVGTFLGLLISYVFGPYLSVKSFNLVCALFPLTFVCVFSAFMVESPHYLTSKNQHERALTNLRKLRNEPSEVVEKERMELQRYVETHDEGSLKELFGSKVLFNCFCVSIGLFVFKHLVGFIAFMNYTQDIFETAGTKYISSDVSTIIFCSVLCVAGIGAAFIIGPRFRFRTVLMCSNIGLITSLSVFGAYFYLKDRTDVNTQQFEWLPLLSMVGIAVSFVCGVGILPPIITSEIIPTKLRALVLAIAHTIDSTECFLISKFYFNLNEAVGMWGSSWIFAGCCLMGLVFDYVLVPETNGITLMEIQNTLRK